MTSQLDQSYQTDPLPATFKKPIGKAPAFQFYPKDYLSDFRVRVMPNAVRGMYITLLAVDWINDGFPEADMFVLSDSQMSKDEWLKGSSRLLQVLFVKHPTKVGYLTSPTLIEARILQADWRQKCSKGGRKSGEIRKRAILSESSERKGSCDLLRSKRELNPNSASASASASTIDTNTLTCISTPPPLKTKKKRSSKLAESIEQASNNATGGEKHPSPRAPAYLFRKAEELLPFFKLRKEKPVIFLTQTEYETLKRDYGEMWLDDAICGCEAWASKVESKFYYNRDHFILLVGQINKLKERQSGAHNRAG